MVPRPVAYLLRSIHYAAAAVMAVCVAGFFLLGWDLTAFVVALLAAAVCLPVLSGDARLPGTRPTPPAPPAVSRTDRAALAALTDADLDELQRLGADLTGIRPPAPTAGGFVAADRADRVSVADGMVRIAHADGSVTEYPLTDDDDTGPDLGPPPDGEYETITDGWGRPIRYIVTD